MAYLYRMFALFGIAPMTRSVRFSGRTLFPGASRSRIFWRMNHAMNQMLMSSYDLHPDNMPDYVERLARFRPELIDGYPSSIFVLARFINAKGEAGRIRPKAIMTTAETLEDHQRDEISRAFGGCPVINQYASSEGAPFITQDTNGEMVINTDTGIFEFVRPGTDVPAAAGELAEMLLTSFTTHAYPLIRYRIGDTVLVPFAPRNSRIWDMPVVEKVYGRQEDILFTRERGYIASLNKVFSAAPKTIRESQIEQVSEDEIILRVCPVSLETFDVRDLDNPRKELLNRVGNVVIRVEIVDHIPRGANGKLRAVIKSFPPKTSL
ncbi:MAG: phenylacetate--CoA ligase family protein [Alphaproteobacteria bacterium]|nr:MAG: phenylacetate--CoA ligase family protein [Alphaproteobacteria bacterium]